MHFDFTVFAGFSISLAAIIGWIRYKNLNSDFLPFLILISIGLVNETISYIVIGMKKSNALNFNIYTLVELLLLTWQFQKWKLFGRKTFWAKTISLTGIIFWITENFIVNSIRSFNSFFLIFSAYIILLMSITMINRLALIEHNLLLKNPIFLICLGLLFFFTYAVLVEAFWLFGFTDSNVFRTRIYAILVVVNLIVNLMYAIAVLWMPTKPKFILPS